MSKGQLHYFDCKSHSKSESYHALRGPDSLDKRGNIGHYYIGTLLHSPNSHFISLCFTKLFNIFFTATFS